MKTENDFNKDEQVKDTVKKKKEYKLKTFCIKAIKYYCRNISAYDNTGYIAHAVVLIVLIPLVIFVVVKWLVAGLILLAFLGITFGIIFGVEYMAKLFKHVNDQYRMDGTKKHE
jgi:hypothetical protein